jgi:hypothetical protein
VVTAGVIVLTLVAAALAGWWLATRGDSGTDAAASTVSTDGWQAVAFSDGTPAILLPDGWTMGQGSANTLEAFSGVAPAPDEARLLISHGPVDVLPMDPAWYSPADVYMPDGARDGSRYVTYTDDRTGAYVVAFVVPLEDGSFLTGQGVLGSVTDAELRAELLAASESAARR